MKNICVYGSVNKNVNINYILFAQDLGKEIANRNYNLIFGGMKNGILGGVANGFINNKKTKIISIMPEFFKEEKKDDIFYDCDEIIYTKDVTERKEKFKKLADAFIILPGGVGTLDELFDAICSKRWGQIDVPIIIFNYNHYYDNLIEMLNYSIKENIGKENYNDTYKVYNNIKEMFDYINNYK